MYKPQCSKSNLSEIKEENSQKYSRCLPGKNTYILNIYHIWLIVCGITYSLALKKVKTEDILISKL